MNDDFPLKMGESLWSTQLSLCVGGLLRTWFSSGVSRLWSVPEAQKLLALQGTGFIGRALRDEADPNRFRETALMAEGGTTLFVRSRVPVDHDGAKVSLSGELIALEPPSEVSETVHQDLQALLSQAVLHCVRSSEYLVVELGGWDAPVEPYCLFALTRGGDIAVSVIETVPPPHGADIWEPHILPGAKGASLSAAATKETIEVAPLIMLQAISTWGVAPWDIALTFGRR